MFRTLSADNARFFMNCSFWPVNFRFFYKRFVEKPINSYVGIWLMPERIRSRGLGYVRNTALVRHSRVSVTLTGAYLEGDRTGPLPGPIVIYWFSSDVSWPIRHSSGTFPDDPRPSTSGPPPKHYYRRHCRRCTP